MPRPWTVLSHLPLQKLQANLWTVEAALPQGPMRRRMGIARLADGRLVLFNAIALDEPSMKELEAFGAIAFAVAGNGFHRLDLGSYKVRYPKLQVLAGPGSRKKIAEITAVDGWLELLPQDAGVKVEELAGSKMSDVAACCTAGGEATLIFPGDALTNHVPMPGFGGFIASALGFVGDLRVPRLIKWIGIGDKAALKAQLVRLADTPGLARILTCHGPVVDKDAAATLRRAAEAA